MNLFFITGMFLVFDNAYILFSWLTLSTGFCFWKRALLRDGLEAGLALV